MCMCVCVCVKGIENENNRILISLEAEEGYVGIYYTLLLTFCKFEIFPNEPLNL